MNMFSIDADPQFVRNQNFHDACRTGDTAQAISLLEANPQDTHLINITRSDFPAVLMAADGQHWDLCAELIRRGVELNVKNRHGYSPLHAFAKHGQSELIQMAVAEGAAYINRKDMHGRTPLHVGAALGQFQTCEKIIELGGEVNALSADKDSALHLALRQEPGATTDADSPKTDLDERRLAVARLLVQHGSLVYGENDLGQTPISLCSDSDLRAELERHALTLTVDASDKARLAERAAALAAATAAGEPLPVEAPAPKRRILKA